MSIIDSHQFLRTIKSAKDFLPAYLFVGDEEHLIAESLARFKTAFAKRYGEANPEFNSENLHGDRDDATRIIESCLTLPFGSSKKLIIVHHMEKLSSHSHAALTQYCLSPNASSCLALLWNARPNQAFLSGEIAKAIDEKGMVIKCWKLYEDKRAQWIKEKLGECGKTISSEAAELLSREGGDSLSELRSEIEKLLLLIGENKEVRLKDVRESMSFRRTQSVWEMAENLEKGNIKKAGQILESCLEQDEEPLYLLNLIVRSCRTRMRAEKSLNANQRRNQPASAFDVSPRVSALFNELKKADGLLKSGQNKESALFERILNLCGSAFH